MAGCARLRGVLTAPAPAHRVVPRFLRLARAWARMTVFTAVAAIGALTFVLAFLLSVANRRLRVFEDPRIDEVEQMLPHANCGACGFPGCRAVRRSAGHRRRRCPASAASRPTRAGQRIAAYLGVDVGAEEKRVARLACAGGSNVARATRALPGPRVLPRRGAGRRRRQGLFLGLPRPRRLRAWSATSTRSRMDARRCRWSTRPSAPPAATASRPARKDLFSIQPVSHRLWVACRSLEAGDEMLADCEVACTACGRCAMDAPRPDHHDEQPAGRRLQPQPRHPDCRSSAARPGRSSGSTRSPAR